MSIRRRGIVGVCALGVAVYLALAAAVATPKEDLPAKTHDGLVLRQGTEMYAVYERPGADLGEYDKIALIDIDLHKLSR